MEPEIATLRLSDFHTGSLEKRRAFCQALFSSLSSTGCARLLDHGISQHELQHLFHLNASFFDLEWEQKLGAANPPGPHPQRGWSRPGEEKTGGLNAVSASLAPTGKTNADAKEHFDIGCRDDSEFANRWPAEEALPKDFRPWLEDYFDRCQDLSLTLMKALEEAAGLESEGLTALCHGASELRLNHYPAISAARLSGGADGSDSDASTTRRIWPHTDFGMLTLLTQDDRGGLQVEHPAGSGHFVPVHREHLTELLVNVGDTLERWTNGQLRAVLHQVTNPPPLNNNTGSDMLPARYSAAFFLKAHRDVCVGALPHFVTAKTPKRFENMTALEYQQQRTALVYAY